jgi:hypothetical protein
MQLVFTCLHPPHRFLPSFPQPRRAQHTNCLPMRAASPAPPPPPPPPLLSPSCAIALLPRVMIPSSHLILKMHDSSFSIVLIQLKQSSVSDVSFTMGGTLLLVACFVVGAQGAPSEPHTIAKLVGDAFLKSSSPPIQRKDGT